MNKRLTRQRNNWQLAILGLVVAFVWGTTLAINGQLIGAAQNDSIPNESSQKQLSTIKRLELAGPLFALLRSHDLGSSLSDIDVEIESALKSGLNELDSVLQVSMKNGLELQHTSIPVNRPELIPAPSILIISRSARPGQNAALMLVEAKSDQELQVNDVQSGAGRGFVSFNDLDAIWYGDVILIKPKIRFSLLQWGTIFLMSGVLIVLLVFVFRTKPSATALLIAGSCILCASCATEQSSQWENKKPIFCLTGAVHDLGVVDGGEQNKVPFSIPLKNESNQSITVTQLRGSCACLELKSSFFETPIGPNEEFELLGTLDLSGKTGEEILFIRIESESGQSRLPSSRVGLRYFAHPRVVSSDTRIEFEGYAGDFHAKGLITLNLYRQLDDPKLELDLQSCQTKGASIKIVSESYGTPVENSQSQIKDTLVLELTTSIQEKFDPDTRFSFVAKHYDSALTLIPAIQIKSPATCTPERLFLGFVKKGDKISKKVAISFEKKLPDPSTVKFTMEGGNGFCEMTSFKILNPNKAEADLEFTPTDGPGRHARELKLGPQDCFCTLNITWIEE